MINTNTKNKTKMAKELGVSRSSLYYHSKRSEIDLEVKNQIESVMTGHPAYGHKRVALELKLNKKRIRRVMKKFNLKPYRKKARLLIKKADLNKPATEFPNLIENLAIDHPHQAWCTDFTYIKFGVSSSTWRRSSTDAPERLSALTSPVFTTAS